MGWVYYLSLVDSKFQAKCLEERLRQSVEWLDTYKPQYIAVYQTPRGKYGIKALL